MNVIQFIRNLNVAETNEAFIQTYLLTHSNTSLVDGDAAEYISALALQEMSVRTLDARASNQVMFVANDASVLKAHTASVDIEPSLFKALHEAEKIRYLVEKLSDLARVTLLEVWRKFATKGKTMIIGNILKHVTIEQNKITILVEYDFV